MKKRWLLLIVACIISISFTACQNNGNSGNGGNEGGGNNEQQQPLDPDSTINNPDYGLGDYENENEEDWWNKPDEPQKPEDSEISGETLPY
jgi:hypothetical protein